jgi:hypothetical protein
MELAKMRNAPSHPLVPLGLVLNLEVKEDCLI